MTTQAPFAADTAVRAARSLLTPIVRRVSLGRAGAFLEVLQATHCDFTFAAHAHAEYSFGIALTGSHVLVVDGRRMVVQAGDVVVLPPETMHVAAPFDGLPWSYLMLTVSPKALEVILSTRVAGILRGRGGAYVLAAHPAANLLHRAGAALLLADPVVETACDSILRFCRLTLEVAPPCEPNIPPDPTAAAVLADLRDPTTRSPSLQATCAAHGVSVFRTIRRFRDAMGIPPIAFYVQLRARRARELILETRSISAAAQLAGYADQSHLTRHFKRIYGITPGVYLRGVRSDADAEACKPEWHPAF